jgi:K+-sensing histidine kinase KdpD
MREEQDRWIAASKKRAQKSLDQAGRLLTKSGIPSPAVQMLFCEPGEPEETADRLLRMATECECHTVVVGRRSVSWLHELFSQDIAEELLRRGKGFCIWVVE